MLLFLKTSRMSRLKQDQSIDTLINTVKVITESQCSLSEQDIIILEEVLHRLQFLKRRKGKTNKQILDEIAKVIVLLTRFFVPIDLRS